MARDEFGRIEGVEPVPYQTMKGVRIVYLLNAVTVLFVGAAAMTALVLNFMTWRKLHASEYVCVLICGLVLWELRDNARKMIRDFPLFVSGK